MEILSGHGIEHIASESESTHAGRPKRALLQGTTLPNNLKSVLVKFREYPAKFSADSAGYPFQREVEQRNALAPYLLQFDDNDVVILSDVDEIPDLSTLRIPEHGEVLVFKQRHFCYYANVVSDRPWEGTRVFRNSLLRTKTVQEIRNTDGPIIGSGWHLSFMGGEDAVKRKISSYSCQYINRPDIHASIPEFMTTFRHPQRPEIEFRLVGRDDVRIPKVIRENWGKYVELGLVKE